MKLYVPEISDELRLLENWTFDLYNEDRNSTMMEYMGDPREVVWHKFSAIPTTILACSILKVDRIYIRKGAKEYSSLSFYLKGQRTQPKMVDHHRTIWAVNGHKDVVEKVKQPARSVRFWAKLADVNNIVFEPV